MPDLKNHFASLQGRFNQSIYGTSKGRLRLDILAEDFRETIIPSLNGDAQVLDIGCGEAFVSEWLIAADYAVTLLDACPEVIAAAKIRLRENHRDLTKVCWCQGFLQNELTAAGHNYDLIIMHAVLEWLDDPLTALQLACDRLAAGGVISLAFYNRNSLLYRNLLQGNFNKIKRDDWQQSSTGLTPQNPIDPTEIREFFDSRKFTLVSQRGIRCFYDFMREPLKRERSYDDVLAMEKRFSQQQPFMSLGRYLHVVWKKPV